jgi:hypothetical protein
MLTRVQSFGSSVTQVRLRDGILTSGVLPRYWPALVICVYVLAAYGRFMAADFASSDWWPVLATNHVATWADIPRIFTEPNAIRDPQYVASTALDYRPLGTASYALDYHLWGFDHPWGYQLTNLLLHSAVVFGTYGLARALGLPRWASVLGALVFTSHPAIVATEPGIGRRLDTLSASLALASALLLMRGSWHRCIAASILFVGSVLAKETSLAMLPLIGAALLIAPQPALRLARERTGLQLADLRPALRLVWLAPSVALALGARLLVLGNLGGYGTAAPPSLAQLSAYRDTLVRFLGDFAAPGPEIGTYMDLSVRLSLLTVLVLAAAFMCPPRERRVALLGLLWFFVYAEFYALLRVHSGWYLYQPLIGIGLLVAALAAGAKARWPSLSAFPALGLAVAASVVALHASPLITPYPEWLDVSRQVDTYLAAVDACAEDGDPPLVSRQKGPYAEVIGATGLADYSVRAYFELKYPDGRAC